MHLFNYKHQVMHLKTGFSSESKILDGCLCVLDCKSSFFYLNVVILMNLSSNKD